MKIKGWLGASLVLLMALSGTILLFRYADQMKSESLQLLQKRVNEMEWQRFESDKAQQVLAAAQTTTVKFDDVIKKQQMQIEALADKPVLRRSNATPADQAAKKNEFAKVVGGMKTIRAAWLSDETGQIVAAVPEKQVLTTLAPTPAFQIAAKQRAISIHPLLGPDDKTLIQYTIPCLSDKADFLGVLQAEVEFSAEDLKHLLPQSGLLAIIGDESGQRLSAGPAANYPKQLGEMIGKNPDEVRAWLQSSSEQFLKATWAGSSYILAAVPTQTAKIYLFVLLGVSGLERVVGPTAAEASLLEDPLVLGGLAVIVVISLLLLMITTRSGGSDNNGVKKLNQQLTRLLEPGQALQPIEPVGVGDWQQVVEQINQVIEKAQPITPASPDNSQQDALMAELQQVRQELQVAQEKLIAARNSQEDTNTQNQTLNTRMTELVQQLETAQAELEKKATIVTPPPAPAVAQQQMEKINETLKQAGALRIEAITSISEDLKATLQVIKNYISSILASEEGKITDAQQEFLGVVINKSARLERQINDLLDISHMESGFSQIYRSRTDLVSMLQDVVLNSQPQADIKHVKIIQDIHAPLSAIMIDSDRMGQVFFNLVQHAIKISPVNGEAQVTAIETFSDIVVKIRDGGTPLTQEQAGHVFNIFHGPDSDAGPDISGSGLRFSIIKRIIDAHQGQITMRGLPDQGNETVITFAKTDELMAPVVENTSTMSMYEIKPKNTAGETANKKGENETPYDLAAFIGKMGDINQGSNEDASTRPLPGAHEDLDKLLSDIEHIDNRMEK